MSKLPFEKPTVLVVDDNEDALSGVAGMLEIECKFTVLTARSGASALKIAGEMDREIHLLLTDVNMPFMSGPELATTLERMRPDLGVVLMSGSFDGFALLSGRKWLLLHKPFGAAKLLQTVDEAISMRSTLVRTSASR